MSGYSSAERLAVVETEVKSVKDVVNRIESKINDLGASYATAKDVIDIESRLAKLENRRVVKDTLMWVGLVASVLLNLYALFKVLG